MKPGQTVRVKPASRLESEWNLQPGAEGTVICQYRILSGISAACERVDVKFPQNTMIWGAAAQEFLEIGDLAETLPRG